MEKEALEEVQTFWNREEQKRAWTYSRIDAPDDAHGRLKSQKKELYDYAEQLGFVVVGSSEDLSGGLDFKRAGIMEVMKAAADGKFDVLLVKRLVCLSRDTVKMLEFLRDSTNWVSGFIPRWRVKSGLTNLLNSTVGMSGLEIGGCRYGRCKEKNNRQRRLYRHRKRPELAGFHWKNHRRGR